jgi:uncharacterized protein (TIGR03435 family)
MSRIVLQAGIVIVLSCCAKAQTPAFDAASIKPNKTGSNSSSSNSHSGVLTATNVSLKQMIMQAYRLPNYRVTGPDWLTEEKFDVSARPPAGTKEADLPAMMQSMLLERFKLAVHRDTKVFPVYGLIPAKGGPKFQAVADEGGHNTNSSRGTFKGERCSMPALAEYLARQMDRPVLDMTELKGVFNLTINFTPEDVNNRDEGKADRDAYPPLLTALQEQLGLRLDPRKAPIEILVVDHVERVPTEN